MSISIISDPNEFVTKIQNPNINEVLVFLPPEYKILRQQDFNDAAQIKNRIVYADVVVNKQIVFHPCFSSEILQNKHIQFISPLIYCGSQPLYITTQINSLNDLTKHLLSQQPGYHIQIPIYELQKHST